MRRLCLIAFVMAVAVAGQTRVDIQRQSKGTEFLAPPFAKPLRSGASLPLTCTVNELFFLTTAPAGSNIHVCHQDGEWAPQGSGGQANITVLSDGVMAGIKPSINFVPGAGLSQVVTVMPSQLNVQQSVDTAVLMTNARNQSGETLLCASASGSSTVYTCAMQPLLGELRTGMVLHWRPDLTNTAVPPTLEVDLLGPKPVKLGDGSADPRPGDFRAGRLYPLWYDGNVFRVFEGPWLENYLAVAASQSGATAYCASDNGSGSAYTCSLTPALGVYSPGMMLHWRPDVSSAGGPTTITVDNLPPQPLKLANGVADPGENELLDGELYLLWYDGSSFRVTDFLPRQVLLRAEYQSGSSVLCVSAETVGQSFACSLNPNLSAYSKGQILHWIPDVESTGGAVTLDVDGLGAIAVKRSDGIRDPALGDFRAGGLLPLWYDGVNFRMVSSVPAIAGGDSRPDCEAPLRGKLWFSEGAANEADTLLVCAKDAANTYAWSVMHP
ncbi:MAG: hypothetical protein KIT83_05750 [Bryobacterales bacterium]|nr:hypothetical protein [Bryobacterales bacterium]